MRRVIAAGTLGAGQAVPSVRDLARDLQVNPMTVSKAYQHLTDAGLLEVRRGSGTFVAAGVPRAPRAERLRDLKDAAARYAAHAASLGVTLEDARRALAAAWPTPTTEGEER